MEAMTTMSWTDDRLDDLNKKVDGIDERIDVLSREMHAEFKAVRGEMKEGFDAVQRSIYVLMTTLILVLGGIVAAAQF
jgi:hypothetical protein